MTKFDFNNKSFQLVQNAESGQVNQHTTFHYQQTEDLVTADYSGGSVIYGKIVAKLVQQQLHMRYCCLTTDKALKSGKAIADISLDDNGKIILNLNWQWLDARQEKGTSIYLEC